MFNKMDSHLPKLEVRAYYDKPICEQVLKEIIEMRREFSKRLVRTEAIIRETCAALRDAKDRLDKIEAKLGDCQTL
jgi:hypothetical protein